MNRNVTILTKYLKDFLHDKNTELLDLSEVETDFWELAEGLRELHLSLRQERKDREELLRKDDELVCALKIQKQLESMVYHDAMTGFHNRRYFMEMMQQAREKDQMFCLCFVDIDGLKYVNDHYGHSEGDEYIRLIGDRIRSRLRLSDVFARLGGDEFGVILRGTNSQMAQKILQNIYDAMRRTSEKEYEVGFSFGVVEVHAQDKTTTKELMVQADQEMYECKNRHRMENKNIRSGGEGIH